MAISSNSAISQASGFARVYATYGGFFIIMSILWSVKFDHFLPDKYDVIGDCAIGRLYYLLCATIIVSGGLENAVIAFLSLRLKLIQKS